MSNDISKTVETMKLLVSNLERECNELIGGKKSACVRYRKILSEMGKEAVQSRKDAMVFVKSLPVKPRKAKPEEDNKENVDPAKTDQETDKADKAL